MRQSVQGQKDKEIPTSYLVCR